MKSNEIKRLLPEIFQQTAAPGTLLSALLEVMETLHEPSEEVLRELDTYFDPIRAPDRFLLFLASWVNLDRLWRNHPTDTLLAAFPNGVQRLRQLVIHAVFLAQWRGTSKGLVAFLELATGISGFVIEEQVPGPGGDARPFFIRVSAPQAAVPFEALLRYIIELEKPAYVQAELQFDRSEEETLENET